MQNIPDGCELDVRLPELENLTVHYFGGNGDAVQSMLDAATKLQAVEQRRHCLCQQRSHGHQATRSDCMSVIKL